MDSSTAVSTSAWKDEPQRLIDDSLRFYDAATFEADREIAKLGVSLDLKTSRCEELYYELSAALHRIMCDAGFSRREVAQKSGNRISKSAVANYVGEGKGVHCLPRTGQLKIFLEVCGCTPAQVEFLTARVADLKRLFPDWRQRLKERGDKNNSVAPVARVVGPQQERTHTARVDGSSPGKLALAEAQTLVGARSGDEMASGSMLVSLGFRAIGIEVPAELNCQIRAGEPVESGKLELGDIIVLSTARGIVAGLYLGAGNVLTGDLQSPVTKLVSANSIRADEPGFGVFETARRIVSWSAEEAENSAEEAEKPPSLSPEKPAPNPVVRAVESRDILADANEDRAGSADLSFAPARIKLSPERHHVDCSRVTSDSQRTADRSSERSSIETSEQIVEPTLSAMALAPSVDSPIWVNDRGTRFEREPGGDERCSSAN